MKILLIALLIYIIVSTITFSIIYIKKEREIDKLIGLQEDNNAQMLTILKNIALAFKVRVVRVGNGSASEAFLEKYEWYVDLGFSNEATLEDPENSYIIFPDYRGDLYIINFRVYGKYFIVFAKDELTAWSNLVKKSMEEYKRLSKKSSI